LVSPGLGGKDRPVRGEAFHQRPGGGNREARGVEAEDAEAAGVEGMVSGRHRVSLLRLRRLGPGRLPERQNIETVGGRPNIVALARRGAISGPGLAARSRGWRWVSG
jgi:hypothetical protein